MRSNVEKVRVQMLNTRDSAQFLSRSMGWLAEQRIDDLQALALGKEISGPPWSVVGKRVFYKVSDLEGWREKGATPLVSAGFSIQRGKIRRASVAVGAKFGLLTVIEALSGREAGKPNCGLYARVRCKCGREKTVRARDLTYTVGIRQCGMC